jgi:hypothetical protein
VGGGLNDEGSFVVGDFLDYVGVGFWDGADVDLWAGSLDGFRGKYVSLVEGECEFEAHGAGSGAGTGGRCVCH